MTTTVFAAAIRMPHAASVAAPAPLALGDSAEPCAANRVRGLELGGIIAPAAGGRRSGTEIGDRFGSEARSRVRSAWYGQDSAQLAGGGPLRT